MKRTVMLSLFLVTAFFSCKRAPEKNLPGVWAVTRLKYPEINSFLKTIPLTSGMSEADESAPSIIARGNFYHFYIDHSFTALSGRNHFFTGRWQYDAIDSTIHLLPRKGDSILFKLVKMNATEMVVQRISRLRTGSRNPGNDSALARIHRMFPVGDSIMLELTIVKEPTQPENNAEDYASPENNTWRIRPAAPESHEQIKQRVMGCLRFSILYLSANAKKNDDDGIPLRPIILPVVIAYNGLSLEKPFLVEPEWKTLFYNNEQAMEGYKILKESFSHNIKMPDGVGVDLDIELLKKILHNISA